MVPFALAACSSTTPGQSGAARTTTSAAPPPATLSCSSITASTVSAALGVQVTGPTFHPSAASTSCAYAAGTFRAAVEITVAGGVSASTFDRDATTLGAYGATTSTVPGLGDLAMASSLGAGPDQTTTVAALSGTTEVIVSAAAPVSRIETLVQQVLGRL